MIDLIFLHGFFSSPQSRKIQHFLDVLPESSIGEHISSYTVIDLYPTQKEFEEMTVSKLAERIHREISQQENECVIIGSSHGGLLSLATQKLYPDKVKAMVLLAPAIEYYDILKRRYDLDQWKELGSAPMEYDRFEGTSHLSAEYVKDLEQYQNWKDPNLPVLLIHGKKDTIVPISYSREYASKLIDCTEFYPAEGIHNLGNVINQLTSVMISWFEEKLL